MYVSIHINYKSYTFYPDSSALLRSCHSHRPNIIQWLKYLYHCSALFSDCDTGGVILIFILTVRVKPVTHDLCIPVSTIQWWKLSITVPFIHVIVLLGAACSHVLSVHANKSLIAITTVRIIVHGPYLQKELCPNCRQQLFCTALYTVFIYTYLFLLFLYIPFI